MDGYFWQRIVAKNGQSVQLDHYLDVLKTKPGALPGFTALALARESGAFTSAHDAFWAASRRVNGDTDGTRELIDVLLLHRSMDPRDVQEGIAAALGVGAVSADVVAVEARRYASGIPAGGAAPDRHLVAREDASVRRVVSLTQRNGVLHSAVGSLLLEGKTAFWNGKRKRFKNDHPEAGKLMYTQLSLEQLDDIGESIYRAMDELASLNLGHSS